MGFGTVATHIILFIAMITVASGAAVLLKTTTEQTSSALRVQRDILVDQLRSDLTILTATYDNETSTVILYVKNTGKTQMQTTDFDVFVRGIRVPAHSLEATLEADTDTRNPGLFDPTETLRLDATVSQSPGLSVVTIVGAYGTSDEVQISW
jgi:flagellar protein FlaG